MEGRGEWSRAVRGAGDGGRTLMRQGVAGSGREIGTRGVAMRTLANR